MEVAVCLGPCLPSHFLALPSCGFCFISSELQVKPGPRALDGTVGTASEAAEPARLPALLLGRLGQPTVRVRQALSSRLKLEKRSRKTDA